MSPQKHCVTKRKTEIKLYAIIKKSSVKSKKHIFIVGHNELLSSCELFCVDETLQILDISKKYLIVKSCLSKDSFRLCGGIVKSGFFLGACASSELAEMISAFLIKTSEKKITFALSNYGSPLPLLRLGKEIKKICLCQGMRVRFVPPQGQTVSSASLLFNRFSRGCAYEFLLTQPSRSQQPWMIFLTEWFQDLPWYTRLEQILSLQDYRSGVLPLRLAQMLLNIAGVTRHSRLLDPFCGSGVLLGVAALQGVSVLFGTDIAPGAIATTKKHLDKIRSVFRPDFRYRLSVVDASQGFQNIGSVDCIVTEPSLGPPRRSVSPQERKQLGELYVRSFRSFRSVLAPNGRVLFLFPVFRSENDFSNELRAIGRLGFRPIDLLRRVRPFFPYQKALIYKRPHQRVGRLITLWERL